MTIVKNKQNADITEWFEGIIHAFKSDQLMVEQGVAPGEKQKLYEDMMAGNDISIAALMFESSKKMLIPKVLSLYFKEISARKVEYTQLAFDLSDTKVLIWAEINDADEKSEQGLYLAQAKVNAEFDGSPIKISTTVIEKGDNLSIPQQYIQFSH